MSRLLSQKMRSLSTHPLLSVYILKEQLNDKVISILLSSGFEMECIYKSKDNNDNLDIITFSKIL